MPRSLRPGDRAPAFELPGPGGRPVRMDELLDGATALVVYFYPKDDTPGCTAEACAFRDDHDAFAALGARVVGVSADPPDRHAAFAARHGLPFPLLSDVDGALRRAWGVPRTLGLLPGRVTYVLDGSGVVRHVFSSQLRARDHAAEALRAVRRIAGGPPTSA